LGFGPDLLVVDDNSPDGTFEIVEMARTGPNLHLIRRAANLPALGSSD